MGRAGQASQGPRGEGADLGLGLCELRRRKVGAGGTRGPSGSSVRRGAGRGAGRRRSLWVHATQRDQHCGVGDLGSGWILGVL